MSRALQAQQQELQRQKVTDSLKKGLEQRPEREHLVESTTPYISPYASHSYLMLLVCSEVLMYPD